MLTRLHIEDFALVDNLDLTLDVGFNVLTGETGAGKSIIVGAIAQLLGEKADKDDIRSGAKLAVVEGDFQIAASSEIPAKLIALGIEYGDDHIILRKEILLKGSTRNFVNGQLVTLAQLREITRYLAELFGQHSHQLLLDENNHQTFLDRFAGLTDQVAALQELFHRWESAKRELINLESRRELEKNERELFLFQKEEIEKVRIQVGEELHLVAEKKILDASRLLGEKATGILNIIEQEDNSALNMLRSCRKELSQMSGLDPTLEKQMELLDNSIVNLEEFRVEMESYRASIPDDPERQETINQRLDEIYRLKKKYGGSEETILETLQKIESHLGTRIDIDEHIGLLQNEETRLAAQYGTDALAISARRREAAVQLAARVEKELKQLGIDSARFRYDFSCIADPEGILLDNQRLKPGPCGLETGRFLISANPGEPLKPLARTASGGEISRIMLALKAADKTGSGKYRPLLVLDEIDSGIGGTTAHAVAKKLAALSTDYQTLVITHLHQIAALSENHYAVEKVAIGSPARKVISIRKLNRSERQKEIRRMLSLTESSKV